MSQIKAVSSKLLSEWLTTNEALLIDVREPFEFQAESIDGAINIPLSQVIVQIEKFLTPSNKKVVIQCKSGYRSFVACQMIQSEGISCDLYNLEGGIQDWKNSNLPTCLA